MALDYSAFDQKKKTEKSGLDYSAFNITIPTRREEAPIPTPLPTKEGTDVLGAISVGWEALTKLPKAIQARILTAGQGHEGASVAERDRRDEIIRLIDEDLNAFYQRVAEEYGNKTFFPHLKVSEVANLPRNMAYSFTSGGAGLAVGVTVGLGPAGPIAGRVAGTLTSGKVAYEMTTYDIMQEYLEIKDEESIKEKGIGITIEEEKALKLQFQDDARKYGLWEAIPEAVSGLAFWEVLTAPLSKMFGKSIAARITSKLASIYGMEFATETITEMGQKEVRAGVPEFKEEDINWLDPKDWGQAFRDIAPQTFLLTTIAGGAGEISKSTVSLAKEIGKDHPLYNKFVEKLKSGELISIGATIKDVSGEKKESSEKKSKVAKLGEIGKELIEEAKKHESVEEFIDTFNKKPLSEKGEFLYSSNIIEKINKKLDVNLTKELIENPQEAIKKYPKLQELYDNNKLAEIANDIAKSQLTDIYNKAQEVKPEIEAEKAIAEGKSVEEFISSQREQLFSEEKEVVKIAQESEYFEAFGEVMDKRFGKDWHKAGLINWEKIGISKEDFVFDKKELENYIEHDGKHHIEDLFNLFKENKVPIKANVVQQLTDAYSKAKKAKPTQKEVVKKAIKDKPKTAKEIATETKILEPNVRRILGVGTKEGVFERVDKGVYVLRKGGKDIAVIYPGDALEILPKLVKEGFKADMVFLDIPYDTPAVKGGNRPMGYDFITPKQFEQVVNNVKDIVRSKDSAVFYMYSQAKSGAKKMIEYNNVMTNAGFVPLAKGEYTKLTKDGKRHGFPTVHGFQPLAPEGLIMFNLSGKNIAKVPVNLDFKLVRPRGWKSEKSAVMLKDLIELSTKEGDVVLDPFAGSGVTIAEAVRAKRKGVGIELEEEAIEKYIKPKVEEAAKEIKAKPETKETKEQGTLVNMIDDILKEDESLFKKELKEQEAKILTELEVSEPRGRIFKEGKHGTEVSGYSSTFPQWIPVDLRIKKLLEIVAKHIENGTKPNSRNVRQVELYNIVKERIFEKAGIDVEVVNEIKEAFLEKEKSKKEIKGKDKVAKEETRRLTHKEVGIRINAAMRRAAYNARVSLRKELMAACRDKISRIQNIKKDVVDYTKEYLPLSQRGKMLTAVKNAKNKTNLEKAIAKIDDYARTYARNAIKKNIIKALKLVAKADNIAIDYKAKIKDLIKDVELRGRSERIMNKIKATKEYIDREQEKGKTVEMPKRVIRSLSALTNKAWKEVTLKELQALEKEILFLIKLGKTKLKSINAIYNYEQKERKEELLEGTHKIKEHELVKEEVGQGISLADGIRNVWAKTRNAIQRARIPLNNMDILCDMLDGTQGTYNGANSTVIKATLDRDWGNYSRLKLTFQDKVLGLAKRLNLNQSNFERIGVYAASKQKDGMSKLVDGLGMTEEKVKAVQLTSSEMTFYNEMRKVLDELKPLIDEFMRINYNTPVGTVKNYFSFLTDWKAMDQAMVAERVRGSKIIEYDIKARRTEEGYAKHRTDTKGVQKIKLNSLEIFLRHTDNVAYMLEMGRDTKMLSEIVGSKEYKAKAGPLGTELVAEYLDSIARKGGISGARQIAMIDVLRKNISIGILGYKLSSVAIQPTSILDGAGFIGQYAFKGMMNVTDKKWRTFLMKFPEIKERIGDDPAFAEFYTPGRIAEERRRSFKWLQNVDLYSATSIASGAYEQKMNELGIPIDLEGKPNQEALEYAQGVIRKSQASMFNKDVPLAVSKGMFTGNRSIDRAIFQFQNFVLNRWSNIAYDVVEVGVSTNLKDKTKRETWAKKSSGIIFWQTMAVLAGTGIKMGLESVIDFVLGKDDEDDEFLEKFLVEWLGQVPFVGQLMSVIVYGGEAVPVLETLTKSIEGLKSATTAKTTKSKVKGAIKAGEAVGELLGVPGSLQASQTLRDIVDVNIDSKRSGSASSRRSITSRKSRSRK